MTCRNERGVAVIVVLGLVSLLVLLGLVSGGVVALVVAHRRVQAAADLAALAGAEAVRSGGDPCGAATVVAERNGANADACRIDGPDVTVTVRIELPRLLGDRVVRAVSRAGPVSGPSAGP